MVHIVNTQPAPQKARRQGEYAPILRALVPGTAAVLGGFASIAERNYAQHIMYTLAEKVYGRGGIVHTSRQTSAEGHPQLLVWRDAMPTVEHTCSAAPSPLHTHSVFETRVALQELLG